MRIEVTIAKTSPLPAGAIDALAGELSRRISHHFPENLGERHRALRYRQQLVRHWRIKRGQRTH